jgi:hypothetical protein
MTWHLAYGKHDRAGRGSVISRDAAQAKAIQFVLHCVPA